MRPSLLSAVLAVVVTACGCGSNNVALEPEQPQPLPEEQISAGGGGGGGRLALVARAGSDWAVCAGGSVALGLPGVEGLSYQWAPADGLSDPTVANPTATAPSTITYTLTVTDRATDESATDEVTLTVHPLPTASAGADVRITAGGSVALSGVASGGLAPYSWAWTSVSGNCDTTPCLTGAATATPTVAPASTERFALTATDVFGCRSAADEVTVSVGTALAANAGGSRGLCAGDTVQIGGDATGGVAPYLYQWSASPSCAAPVCISSDTAASPTVTPTATTTFTQTVTDAVNTQAIATTTLTVHPHPGVAGADQFTAGAAVALGPLTPLSTASYAWTCNRADCALSSALVPNPTAQPTRSTRYTLTASSDSSCTVSSTQTVWTLLRSGTVPADGEPAWPVNSKLIVTFDQPILASSLSSTAVRLEDADTGATVSTTTALDATGRRLTITPSGANYPAGDYTLVVSGGETGLRSADATLPSILASDLTVDFTTGSADTTPPAITSRIPASGATNVSPTLSLLVRFSEPIDPATATATTFTLSQGGVAVPAAVTADLATNTVTLTPSSALSYGTTYTVAVAGITDLAANAANASWTFTTGAAPDLTPPTVISVSPAHASTGISVTPRITVTFSEAVLPASAAAGITLRRVSNGSTVSGTVTLDPTSTIATLVPGQLLAGSETYELTVSGVADLSQNAMSGPFTSRFTTRQVLLAENFENGVSGWALTGTWGTTTKSAASPLRSLTDSPGGKYLSNESSSVTLAAPILLSNLSTVSLQFAVRTHTEKINDVLTAEYQLGGGAWQPLPSASFSGKTGWTVRSFSLNTAGATALLLRFRFNTNATRQFDGVFVDDVLVQTP